jgi:hypothetical protein
MAEAVGIFYKIMAPAKTLASIGAKAAEDFKEGGITGVIAGLVQAALSKAVDSLTTTGAPKEVLGDAKPKAEGGPVVANTPYIVGEVGPELFVPNANGTIVPNDQLAATSNNNNVNVTALANAIVAAFQSGVKLEVKMDPTFSGAGMNNPRYM